MTLATCNPPAFPQNTATKGSTERERGWRLGAFLTGITCLGVLLIQSVGTYGAILFLAPLPILVALRAKSFLEGVRRDFFLFVFPFLAVLSTLWSVAPGWSLWASLELVGTVIVGIAVGYCVPYRSVVFGVTGALLLTALGSLAVGVANGGEAGGMAGLFQSKNQFATAIAFLLFISYTNLSDRSMGAGVRAIAVFSILLSMVLIWKAQSVGALVAVFAAFLGMRMLRKVSEKPKSVRRTTLLLLAGGGGVLILFGFLGLLPLTDILSALGRDATLTGRTYLWHEAKGFMAQNPVLGLGYQAFWRGENYDAVRLWDIFGQPPGAGFHFHNMYYNVGVDLGVVGLLIISLTMVVTLVRCIKALFVDATPRVVLAVLLFLFLLIRSFVEVDLTFQFTGSMLFFCLVWAFSRIPDQGAPSAGSLVGGGRKKDASHVSMALGGSGS
ncbi:O-antigen ligase family protein [Pararhodospirillum oryzae]|uniref:Exopolysaccharide production protein ExoQ n=1 Tax=Pararhodospirillum oryzae TaxID=478448 RepID=A0A512H3T5_9PROT|nr:O-antigen ligase family protein [Pararhodospirillum oryzae]GEO80125.1 exopolysaccharide production protein ExoQ [Pararhodospirillum oryzae]